MLRISACSYEGSLFGWNVPLVESEDDILREVKFEYGFHASHGSLRSIACSKSGKYMATGGMNERISVYSLTDNQEMGELAGHSGAITYLQFFQDSFLISASEDHTMYIWRCYDWENIHILGGHTDIVNSFAIHPSGKIALSVSRDKTLKIWNLVQGRCSLSRKMGSPGEFVVWHPSGDFYLMATLTNIQVYATSTNETIADISSRSRINQVSFLQTAEDTFYILYICDNQTVNVSDMSGKLLKSLVLSTLGLGRLKSFSTSFDSAENKSYVTFITSNGALLVVDGNTLLEQCQPSEPLSQEEADLAKSTLQLIKPAQSSTASRPVSASLLTTAAQDEVVFASTLIAFHQLPAEPRLVAVSCFLQKASKASKSQDEKDEEVDAITDEPVQGKGDKKQKKRKAGESLAENVQGVDSHVAKKKSVAFEPVSVPADATSSKAKKDKKNKTKK